MKIYVSTDLEGVGGVFSADQSKIEKGKPEYEKSRQLLTAEVNTLVEGALSAGADEIVVMDGHGGGHNFIIDELHPEAQYITGPGRNRLYPGLDASFDAVLLLAHHAMAGTAGAVLDHTQSSTAWYNYYINGVKMGEIGQTAVVAGQFGVPVIFVSGDKATCDEARALLGDIETAVVKEGLTRNCAKILAPAKAREIIRAGVVRALKRISDFSPYVMEPPFEVRLETQTTAICDGMERTGWQRIDGRTVGRKVMNALEIM